MVCLQQGTQGESLPNTHTHTNTSACLLTGAGGGGGHYPPSVCRRRRPPQPAWTPSAEYSNAHSSTFAARPRHPLQPFRSWKPLRGVTIARPALAA